MGKKDTTKKLQVVKPRKRRPCPFCLEKVDQVDFKDESRLSRFLSDRCKILPRRNSSLCAKHQRVLSKAIKKARVIGIIPYYSD